MQYVKKGLVVNHPNVDHLNYIDYCEGLNGAPWSGLGSISGQVHKWFDPFTYRERVENFMDTYEEDLEFLLLYCRVGMVSSHANRRLFTGYRFEVVSRAFHAIFQRQF